MRKYMLVFLVKWFISLFCGCLCTRLQWETGKKNRKARGMIGSEGTRGTVASRPPAFCRPSRHYGPGSCCRRELEQILRQDKEVSVRVCVCVCVFFFLTEIQTILSSFSDLTEFAHKWISSTLSRAFFSAPIFRLQYSSTGPKMRESGTFNL